MKKLIAETYSEFVNSSLNERMVWKGKNGEYSYKEMYDFFSVIIPYMSDSKGMFPSTISIQDDRISSTVVSNLDDAKKKLEIFQKEYKDENPTYHIWKYEFKNADANKMVKFVKSQRVDIMSLFKAVKKYEGSLKSFSVGFSSDEQSKFAQRMGKDKFLD